MSFLTPAGALVALLGIIPLLAFVISDRRRHRVATLLRIEEPPARTRLAPALALAVLAGLVGIAATQPTLVRRTSQQVRSDAEAWLALDNSLSMAASTSPGAPTRLQRAQVLAEQLRGQLGTVPVGLASISDRALAHLFPTGDAYAFRIAVHDVIGIERPPPSDGFSTNITTLGSIARIATDNFFSPQAKRRLLVVFTDGETKPFVEQSLTTAFRQAPGVHTIFVRIWGAREHVWNSGHEDPLYRPDPQSATYIQQLAAATGGVAMDAGDSRLVKDARAALGSGPTEVLREEKRRLDLAPYLAGVCFLPLGFLLLRRNV